MVTGGSDRERVGTALSTAIRRTPRAEAPPRLDPQSFAHMRFPPSYSQQMDIDKQLGREVSQASVAGSSRYYRAKLGSQTSDPQKKSG